MVNPTQDMTQEKNLNIPTKKVEKPNNHNARGGRRNNESKAGYSTLQDKFIKKAKDEVMMVRIFLTNGYPVEGIVRDFDNFTILLITNVQGEVQERLIYKHALSTIQPKQAFYTK